MDKLAAIFGEPIIAPVCGIPNAMLRHYIFREYNSNADTPLQFQICQALEQQKFISVSCPNKRYGVWTDICQILFCQAFLFDTEGTVGFSHMWEIRNPSAIKTCWDNFRTYKVQDYFKRQWSFLEEKAPHDISFQRRKLLLRRALSNGLKTLTEGNQSTDNAVRRRILLFRELLSNRSKKFSDGNQSAQIKKDYSHYDNELESLLESLSSEDLIIKESWVKIPPSDYHAIVQQRSSVLQEFLSDIGLGSGIDIPNICLNDDFQIKKYSDDGGTIYYRSYHMQDKEPNVIRAEATLKEGIDNKFQHLWPIGYFTGPLIYYLDLLQCIDESSLSTLMEDLFSDFTRPPQYSDENKENAVLNTWRSGMPDIIAYDNENSFHVLLMCKKPKNRLIKTQRKWLLRNLERYKLNVALVGVNENQIGSLFE